MLQQDLRLLTMSRQTTKLQIDCYTKSMVIIYTTTWCGFCKMAKHYMDDQGIEYTEKDVEKDPAAATEAVQKSGQMGVPVIDVNGTIIIGFDKVLLDRAFTANKLI